MNEYEQFYDQFAMIWNRCAIYYIFTWVIFPVHSSHTFNDMSTEPLTRYSESAEHVKHVMLSA